MGVLFCSVRLEKGCGDEHIYIKVPCELAGAYRLSGPSLSGSYRRAGLAAGLKRRGSCRWSGRYRVFMQLPILVRVKADRAWRTLWEEENMKDRRRVRRREKRKRGESKMFLSFFDFKYSSIRLVVNSWLMAVCLLREFCVCLITIEGFL